MDTNGFDKCVKDELKIFEKNVNKYIPRLLSNGETLLSAMIKINNEDVCGELLDAAHGDRFLTIKNADGKLPIFQAIEKNSWGIVQDIIYEISTLNVKDDKDKLPISYIFDKLNAQLNAKPKAERKEIDNNEILDLINTIKIMILRGADITDFLMSVPDRKIRRNLKEYFIYQTVEYENVEVDIKMCSCEKTPAECVIKCGHIFCNACVDTFKECPECYEEAPLEPCRIYQI